MELLINFKAHDSLSNYSTGLVVKVIYLYAEILMHLSLLWTTPLPVYPASLDTVDMDVDYFCRYQDQDCIGALNVINIGLRLCSDEV